MMLSYIIKHIDKDQYAPIVYSEKKWPLINELQPAVPVFSSGLETSRLNRLSDKISRRTFNTSYTEKQLLQIIKKYQPDLIYVNTIVAANIIPVLKKVKIPFVVHCHELTSSYQSISADNLDFFVQKSKLMIGCSEEVCHQLTMLGAANVALVYEAIDTDRAVLSGSKALRTKWNIPHDASIWLMAGLRHYRKGFDFIPAIAKNIRHHNGWLIWLGKPFGTGYDLLIKRTLESGQINNVTLLDEQVDDYFPLLAMADGLVLTSREDPFPLVMLEAAWLGKPIVAFESGGVQEFLKEGMGHLVRNYDLQELSEVIASYSSGKFRPNPAVSVARAKEFEITAVMKSWAKAIEKVI